MVLRELSLKFFPRTNFFPFLGQVLKQPLLKMHDFIYLEFHSTDSYTKKIKDIQLFTKNYNKFYLTNFQILLASQISQI